MRYKSTSSCFTGLLTLLAIVSPQPSPVCRHAEKHEVQKVRSTALEKQLLRIVAQTVRKEDAAQHRNSLFSFHVIVVEHCAKRLNRINPAKHEVIPTIEAPFGTALPHQMRSEVAFMGWIFMPASVAEDFRWHLDVLGFCAGPRNRIGVGAHAPKTIQ